MASGAPRWVRRLDVTQRADLAPAIAAVEHELGGVDILVNNAGNAIFSGGVLNETALDWDTTIATHLNASFLLSQAAAKSMVRRRVWRQDHQPREHVFDLRFGDGPVL